VVDVDPWLFGDYLGGVVFRQHNNVGTGHTHTISSCPRYEVDGGWEKGLHSAGLRPFVVSQPCGVAERSGQIDKFALCG